MRWINVLAAITLAASVAAQVANAAENCEAEVAPITRYDTTIDALVVHGSADALFAAALLIRGPDAQRVEARRLDLLDRAARLAPLNPAIAALAAHICREVAGCNMPAHVQRLGAANPADAGYLMPALDSAMTGDDPVAVTDVLNRIAAHETLDDYWIETSQTIRRGLSQVDVLPPLTQDRPRLTPDMRRTSLARISASMVLGFVGVGNLAKACNPEKAGPAFAPRRPACAHIGAMLEHADSMISNLIGLRLEQWAAGNEAERLAARQRSERIRWQMDAYSVQVDMQDPNVATALFAAQNRTGSEIGGLSAILASQGAPLEPPPGWHSAAWQARHGQAPR